MGATNNIKGVIQSHELKARVCYYCSCSFTDTDLKENNLSIEYRTNHATDWTDFPLQTGRGWIAIEISLYHKECPKGLRIKCKNCQGEFSLTETEEFRAYYYCVPCFQKLKNHV